jgi:Cu2+-exporting ATPase
MKTITIDLGGLLSPLCARGVEKQMCKMPGVKRVDANFASASATVEYDETLTNIEAIRRCVQDCGYRCTGEMLPEHVCAPTRVGSASTPSNHSDHSSHNSHQHHHEHQSGTSKRLR